ncbi:MAG TPA: Yip1 family protein [Gammaproteobacteria bacterium]|nr:Yip1 family protein [Gammaproteobacteria bacterium]
MSGENAVNASSPSAFGSLVNIFLEPRKTFEDVRQHTGWLWYPLLLALGALVVTFVFYYGTADWDVIRQQQTDILSNYHLTRDQIDQALSRMTRTKLVLQTSIGLVVVLSIIYLIQALYLFLAAKVAGAEVQNFGAWFSFTCWAYFPSFLGSIATLAAFLVYGKQATFLSIDVTSLNTLIFKVPVDSPWFNMLNNLHLALFWSFALMTIGFSAWTRKSLGKSAAIVLAPHVLIYGLWIVLKLI